MSLNGDAYRTKAEEAETLAEKSVDVRAADIYRTVATHYRELAEHEDRQDGSARRK